MKRALLLILVLSLILTSLLTLPVASAEPSVPYDLANAYVAAHPRRDVLSGGEAAAAKTLASRLESRGYDVTTPSDRVTVETNDLKTVTYDFSHVIGFKDNGKGRTLLVGCFYGGYEPTDSLGTGEGASVALSVGLLLYVADALVDLPLDYDLAIAFWGGAELGSDIDLDKCGVDLSRLALYVNFDCVAAGSEDYLYADDLPRSQERYFREIAAEQGATFAEAPVYKSPAAFSTASEVYSSLHLGILGANRSFMSADVPCVSFVGGAWDYDGGLYPYRGMGDVEGTSLDTIQEIDRLNGGREATSSRLLATAKTVISALSDSRLTPVLDQAAKETSSADLYSPLAYYLIVGIGALAIIAFFVVLILRQGKDRRDVEWTPPADGQTPTDEPFVEFRTNDGDASDDPPQGSDDDVFRF